MQLQEKGSEQRDEAGSVRRSEKAVTQNLLQGAWAGWEEVCWGPARAAKEAPAGSGREGKWPQDVPEEGWMS